MTFHSDLGLFKYNQGMDVAVISENTAIRKGYADEKKRFNDARVEFERLKYEVGRSQLIGKKSTEDITETVFGTQKE